MDLLDQPDEERASIMVFHDGEFDGVREAGMHEARGDLRLALASRWLYLKHIFSRRLQACQRRRRLGRELS